MLKDYWWILLIFLFLIGGWVYLPFQGGTGEDAVRIEGDSGEQSLRSLEPANNPSETAGVQPASVHQSPRPLPQASAPAASKSKEGKTLAAALQRVSRSSGAGSPRQSSSARADPSPAPFGLGGDPGPAEGGGRPAASSLSASGGLVEGIRSSLSSGQSFGALQRSADSAGAALRGPDEAAAGYGRKTFDAAARRVKGLAGPFSGGGPGLVEGDVPVNLKEGEPHLNSKDFVPPDVGPAAETKDKNKQYMEQQMLMMLLALAVGGFLGTALGAAGTALVRGAGFNPPTQDNMNRVKGNSVNVGT